MRRLARCRVAAATPHGETVAGASNPEGFLSSLGSVESALRGRRVELSTRTARRLAACVLLWLSAGCERGRQPEAPAIPPAAEREAARDADVFVLDLGFEVNRGQAPDEVRFVAPGTTHATLLADDGIDFLLPAPPPRPSLPPPTKERRALRRTTPEPAFEPPEPDPASDPVPREPPHRLRMELVGARGALAPDGVGPRRTRVSHALGPDRARWLEDVPSFDAVRYQGVYPGVDFQVERAPGGVAYRFDIAPGADASVIRLRFTGAEGIAIGRDGSLRLDTPRGPLLHGAPRFTQQGRALAGGFERLAKDVVGFRVEGADPAVPLEIDPVVTFLADVGEVFHVSGLAVASAERVFLAGNAVGASGSSDMLVVRIDRADPAAPAVVQRWIHGPPDADDFDTAQDLALGPGGKLYLTGLTFSDLWLPADGFASGSRRCYVARLDEDLGIERAAALGTGSCSGTPVAVDRSGPNGEVGVTLAVEDWTMGIPSGVPFLTGYILALDSELRKRPGRDLRPVSDFHGQPADVAAANGEAVVVGISDVVGFPPRPGALLSGADFCLPEYFEGTSAAGYICGGRFVRPFALRLAATGTTAFATLLPANVAQQASAVAIDAGGAAYVAGSERIGRPLLLSSTSTETVFDYGASYDPAPPNVEFWKLDASGALVWHVAAADPRLQWVSEVALDPEGHLLATGSLRAASAPEYAFVMRLDANGAVDHLAPLVAGYGSRIRWLAGGTVVVAGRTGAGQDYFVAVLDGFSSAPLLALDTRLEGALATAAPGDTVTLRIRVTNEGFGPAEAVTLEAGMPAGWLLLDTGPLAHCPYPADGKSVVCTFSDGLEAGESGTAYLTLRVEVPGPRCTTATASAPNAAAASVEHCIAPALPPRSARGSEPSAPAATPTLVLLADGPTHAARGAPVAYTLRLVNRDVSSAVGGVGLSAQMGAPVALASATPSQGSCDPIQNASILVCTIGTLPTDGVATVHVAGIARDGGVAELWASASTAGAPAPPSASVRTEVVDVPGDLALEHTAPEIAGGATSFTLRVEAQAARRQLYPGVALALRMAVSGTPDSAPEPARADVIEGAGHCDAIGDPSGATGAIELRCALAEVGEPVVRVTVPPPLQLEAFAAEVTGPVPGDVPDNNRVEWSRPGLTVPPVLID